MMLCVTRIQSPCYRCPDRHPLCHMECPKYLAYCECQERARADRRAERDADAVRRAVLDKRLRIKLNKEKRGD